MIHETEKIFILAAYLLLFWSGLMSSAGCNFHSTETTSDSIDLISSIYIYDFGVVRPNSEHIHVFSLRNSTEKDWKLHRIVQNCSCTVATAGSDRVPTSDFGVRGLCRCILVRRNEICQCRMLYGRNVYLSRDK